MSSYGESYLLQFSQDPEFLIRCLKYNEAPKQLYLYIHAQCALSKQIKAYKCGRVNCKIDERFDAFTKTYAKAENITVSKAYMQLFETSCKTADEMALETVKGIMDEYGISKPALEFILGYNSGDLSKQLNGERPIYKELIMALCMFLEYDVKKCRSTLFNCGYALCDCFPDNIFKKHINSKNYSVQEYVDAVNEEMRKENINRVKSGQRQIQLHNFYRADRCYPNASISVFWDNDHYSFDHNALDRLY